jgi:DNA-directed RNA polymerase subunit RPC12/RpoP
LEEELHRRVHYKDSLSEKEKKDYRVLDSRELWKWIKDNTGLDRGMWCEAVFGPANETNRTRAKQFCDDHVREEAPLELKYSDLRRNMSQADGTNWCRKSKVTGMVPSDILAEIRGDKMDSVPAVYDDPGSKNFTAGVWRVVEDSKASLYAHRITGRHYHHRIGANRERDRRERQDDSAQKLSASQRTSISKARDRRLIEQGKREFFHEILANRRLFADLHGDGRDFVCIFEHSSGGGVGGNSHRMPACEEFQHFMAEFTLVGTMSGYNTSQLCSRCGHRLEYGNKREIRTKMCKSKECTKPRQKDEQQRSRSGYFYVDRYFFSYQFCCRSLSYLLLPLQGPQRCGKFRSDR